MVGRTLPIWKHFAQRPYLFAFFDKIQFYQMSDEQLASLCAEYNAGRHQISITEDTFDTTSC